MLSGPSPAVDGAPSIDVPCLACTYNLRGLLSSGACPECGAPAQPSIDFRLGQSPRVTQRLHRAMMVVVWSLMPVIAVQFYFVFLILAARGFIPVKFMGENALDFLYWAVPSVALLQTAAGQYLCRTTPWRLPKGQFAAVRTYMAAVFVSLVLLLARMILTRLYPAPPRIFGTIYLPSPPAPDHSYYFAHGWLLMGLSGILLCGAIAYAWHMVHWVWRARPYLDRPPGVISHAAAPAVVLGTCASLFLAIWILELLLPEFLTHLPNSAGHLSLRPSPIVGTVLWIALLISGIVGIPSCIILVRDILRLCPPPPPCANPAPPSRLA